MEYADVGGEGGWTAAGQSSEDGLTLFKLASGIRAAGLAISAEEIADILWLSERLPLAMPDRDQPAPKPIGDTSGSKADTGGQRGEREDTAPDDVQTLGKQDSAAKTGPAAGIFTPQMAGTINASTLRVPGVAATDHPEDMRRALQPFARRVPSRWHRVLDEDETASFAAETGVWSPVYRPVRERWFELSVVVESSASMDLWDEALDEFMRALRNQGGFRCVAAYRLDDVDGRTVVTADGRRRHPVSHLLCGQRPHLMLLASDATSAQWRNGAAHAFLRQVGRAASVSVLQPLPRRSWRHTVLGEPELSFFAERAGDANARMKALLPWWLDESDLHASVRVPVVGMDAASIGDWARTMTARGGAAVPGVLLGPPAKPEPGAPPRQTPAQPTPAERLARYRGMVSRAAYELAVFLSVPDPLTVPVMRLVQRTMLPTTGTAELAEFFVGGLMQRVDGAEDAKDSRDEKDTQAAAAGAAGAAKGEPCYRLIDGVRDELTRSLRYSEEGAINYQLRSVGRYLLKEGREDSSFNAVFPSPTGRHRITEWSLPFASVSREVLTAKVAPSTAQSAVPQPEPPPDAIVASNALLYIRYEADQGVLTYNLHDGGPRDTWRMPLPIERIADIGRSAASDPDQLQYYGDRLAPLELAEELHGVTGTVGLLVDAQLQSVPWELLLWTRHERRRELLSLSKPVMRLPRAMSPLPWRGEHPVMWVVGDPYGGQAPLPGAQREATEVAETLGARLPGHQLRTDIRGSSGDLRQQLRRDPFKLLFVSGHGVRRMGPSGGQVAGIQFGQNDLLTVDDVLFHESPPELVFLACNYMADMAMELLSAGVSVVIAAYDVVDEHSAFPSQFFNALTSGSTVAQALLEARLTCFTARASDHDLRWAQYACFGNPAYVLADDPAGAAAAQSSAADGAADPASADPPVQAQTDLDREAQTLLAACSAVPNHHMPSGVHTAVWFGSDMALTIASRTQGDRYHWDEADSTSLPFSVSDVWGHLLGLADDLGGMERLINDESLARIANREFALSHQPQLLLMMDNEGSHSPRRVMPLAGDDEVTGRVQARVLYFVGEQGMSFDVDAVAHRDEGTLQVTPRDSTQAWPLPPEAHGAALVADGRCIGMLVYTRIGDGHALAKDARTLRAALRAAWRMRLQAGLETHRAWVDSKGRSGQCLSLAGADLSGCVLHDADLREAELPAVRWTGSVLDGVRFDRARMPRSRLEQASAIKATFIDADLSSSSLRGARLDGSVFERARLRSTDFVGASIAACRWADADFTDAKFDRSHVSDAALRKALGLGQDEFIRRMTDGPPDDAVTPITVIAARDFSRPKYQSVREGRLRFVAAGDSWFAAGSGTSLLHAMAFSGPTVALDSTLPWSQPAVDAPRPSNMELFELLGPSWSATAVDFDAVLLSAGGDDLIEAASVRPTLSNGEPTPREQRLLLRRDEWKEDAGGGYRYISEQGVSALEVFLQAHFEHIVRIRDQGPMRGRPIFVHGYADPVPRPARTPDGRGPWLQPAMSAYGIPIEDHLITAQTLMFCLRGLLHGICSDSRRFPNVHFFDSSRVPLERAGANQAGDDGDWASEFHPNAHGYAKLARAWSEFIESVMRPRQSAA